MYGWWGWRGQDRVSLYPSRHTTVTLYNNNTTSHTITVIFGNFRETEECLYFPTCISESSLLKQQYKSQDVQVSTKTGNIYDVYFLLGLFLLLRLMLLLLSGGVWGSGRVFLWKPMTGCRVQGASTVWAANTSCYELWLITCWLYALHSAPEHWPREKKTSTPKINPNESVLLLYIDI